MKSFGVRAHRSLGETLEVLHQLELGFQKKESIRWGILEARSGQLIGDVGFWRFVRVRYRAEVGAKLLKSHWNRGTMTIALGAVIQFGFEILNLHSIEGNIDPSNEGSKRLVEKLGFETEGYITEHTFNPFSQSFSDTILYAIRRPKWKPQERLGLPPLTYLM